MKDRDEFSQKKSAGGTGARKAAAREIAESGALLQQIMDTAHVAIFLVDKSGRIVHANRRMAGMFGCPLGELVGSEYVEHVHPSERETGRRKMLALLASEIPAVDLERLYWRRDGTQFWGHLAGRRFHDAQGRDIGLIGVITDISVREQAVAALQQSEAKYRRLYNETPVLLHSIDRDGVVVEVNDHWLKTMGYERGEVIGRKVTDFYTDASREYARETVHPAFFRDGIAEKVAYQFVRKNGEVLDVLLSATAERDAAGTVVRSQAVVVDVTERKRTEEALRQSKNRYRMLYQGTPVMMHSIDTAGRLVSVSDRWLEQLGYTRDEVLGRPSTDFLDERSRTSARTVGLPAFMRTGVCTDVPCTFVKKNGARIPALLSAIAERDAAGKIVHSLAVIIDITERTQAEEALRENQARLEMALQSARMGVWRWEIGENRRYFDDRVCQLLGIPPATFAGTVAEFLQALHPDDRERTKAALARTLEQGAPYEPTYRTVWPDGSVHHLATRGRLVRDDKGQPVRINGILWDISEQSLLEQERIKTQKLESVGTLAGGIAHDFNNLLQGVFGFISMARLTHDQKEKSLAMLEQAERALQQSVNLTTQLLTFSKGGKPIKKDVDLRPLIENAAALALSGSRNSVDLVVDRDLRAVEADAGQIGQVIQNIVLNADQAMPLGGVIRVRARNLPAAAVAPPADLQGDLVEITIRDQGAGIPAEHLTSIFDPYFTTKEKGSGLGLATSYSIIRNHGGVVRVESQVGRGTTFRVYLPASGAHAAETQSPALPAAARKGEILVMDDEEMVRELAQEMLAALGHEAAAAENGETALAAYRAALDAGRPFDVVILDLTIRGGMGGIEAMRGLIEIDPAVKAVVSSGYSEEAALANYHEQGFRAVLNKPYSITDLERVLNSLLP